MKHFFGPFNFFHKTIALAFAMLMVLSAAATAQESPEISFGSSFDDQDLKFIISGEYRVRYLSHTGLDFTDANGFDVTTQRARLGVRAEMGDDFAVFFQLQDVRTWGEESDTLNDSSADQFDLHQGYADLFIGEHYTLRLGRQEIAWDEERLMGAVGWSDQGRSFDGVRLIREYDNYTVEMFYARLREEDTTPSTATEDLDLAGFRLNLKLSDNLSGTFLHIYDHDNVSPQRDRHTTGIWGKLTLGGLETRGEFYYQYGTIHHGNTDPVTGIPEDIDIRAIMGSLKAIYTLKTISVSGWYDYLSGDSDLNDNEMEAFDTLFATNHNWYGYMDLFTDIPAHTGGRGLNDYGAGLTWKPSKKFSIAADYHIFQLAVEDNLDDSDLGRELDTTVVYKLKKHFEIVCGYSKFWPGDAMENLKGGDDTEQWGYAMGRFMF